MVVAVRTIRRLPVVVMAAAVLMVRKRHALPRRDGSHPL